MSNNALETMTIAFGCAAIGAVAASLSPRWIGLLIAMLFSFAYVSVVITIFKIAERVHA